MKITKMTVRRIEVDPAPYYGPHGIPDDDPKTWEFPLLVLDTDEGLQGWSMCYGTKGVGRGAACQLLDVFRYHVLGADPFESEGIWDRLRRLQRHLYPMSDVLRGVVDVALWDLKGKALGQPIAKLIGVARTRVPTYATATPTLKTPQEVHDEALAKKKAGFHGYKMQWRDGAARDVPRLRAARQAVGDDFPLMHDPHSMYNFEQALEVGRHLDELNFLWFEEPLPDRQTTLIRKLAQELRTPILTTETLMWGEIAEVIRNTSGDMLRGDVMLKSGVTGLRKMIGACEMFGLNIEIHTATTPLMDVANLHVACTTHLSRFVESHNAMFKFGLRGRPLDMDEDGCLCLPQGPGLGVELDWDWLDNHTLETLAAE